MGVVCVLLLVLSGCEPSEHETASSRDVSPTPDDGPIAVVEELPSACKTFRGRPPSPQVTFSKDDRIFALDPATGDIECIEERGAYSFLSWGALGDRLVSQLVAIRDGSEQRLPGDQRQTAWSRPTGTSVVYISHDYSRLIKEEVATGETTDISLLEEHFDVAYHPSGTHIAVSGIDGTGRVGLFLATNVGTSVQQIVKGEHAVYVDGLSFSGDGRRLYFRADHGDYFELHSVKVKPSTDEPSARPRTSLTTIAAGPRAPSLSVSPFGNKERLLYSLACAPSGEAFVKIGDNKHRLDPQLGGIEPVGWLPDGSVVFLAFGEARCDDFGEGDLYRWADGDVTSLVRDVDVAAVRAVLPDPPDPPAETQGVVA